MTQLAQILIESLGTKPAAKRYAEKVANAKGEDAAAYANAANEICDKCHGIGTICQECPHHKEKSK